MTTLNGSTLDHLHHRLQEAFDDLYDSFVDPREALVDDDGLRWQSLGTGGAGQTAAGPAFSSEQQLAEIRGQCRALALGNEYALNGHENRISYIVGAGHTYRASVRKHCGDASTELAAGVQAVVDRFIEDNHWQRRQQELVLRLDRDGEVFLRFFTSHDGSTRIRFVEPDQVSTPTHAASDRWSSFGIRTEPDDVETPLAYAIDGVEIEADEIQHRKSNVDGNVKRGLPLFYPVRKNLRRAEKLLRNMSVVAEIQSAIAIIRKHRGATRGPLQQFVSQQADVTATSPVTGRTTHFQRYAPGTILDASAEVDYDFPAAALDAGSYVTVLQAELRAIASRLCMPEFMLSSNAADSNYASTMVAEGPAVRMFERLQAQQIEWDLAVMRRVVTDAIRAGRLPAETLDEVSITAAAPSLAIRDRLTEARAWDIAFRQGVLSPQTWSQKLGLDYDQEQANLTAHACTQEK